MHDLTTGKEQLLKPTATIHVGNKFSLIERKIFNAIIWHSQKRRIVKHDNTISVGLLMSLIGLERSKNLDIIKEALEKFTTNPIIWNTLKKDRTTDWGICTFLAGAELSGGQLRYVLNPLLIEKVNHPTLFAKIQLLMQTRFSSKYSLALYEFLLDELGRAGNPATHEVQAPLDIIRHVLQFDGAYKHLNSDVLKPCVREVNKYSDIQVGYRGIKEGRAVVALLFSIERTGGQIQLLLDDLRITDTAPEPPLALQEELALSLVGKGVGKRKAWELVDTYDAERIRDNIEYAEREHEAGKVKKLSAYLIKAIEEDYRPQKTKEDLRKAAEAAEKRKYEEEIQAKKTLEKEWNRFRFQRVRELFAELSPEEQEKRRHAFAESLRQQHPFLYGQYKKEGFRSRMVENQFFHGLQNELLRASEETDFDAYLAIRKKEDRKGT